jgi:hypothetical protein
MSDSPTGSIKICRSQSKAGRYLICDYRSQYTPNGNQERYMAQLWRLLCFLVLICSTIWGAPISTARSIPDAQFHESAQPAPDETHPEGVTLSSFGRLAVNVGIGGGLFLGAIVAAEAALYLIGVIKKSMTEREQLEFLRASEQARRKDQVQREQQALEILLDMAGKQAHKVSAEGFEKKLKPFVVPKEIHKGLEGIFKGKDDEDETGKAFHDLQDALLPLLEFEESD